jgi:hypothetical protein
MSLRLIKPGLTGIFHTTMRDPRTGKLLEAVGVGKRGPIWPVMGGSGEGEGESDEDKEDDDSSSEDDSADDKDDDNPEGLKARIKALEEEKDRHYKKAQKALTELEELRLYKNNKENEGLSDEEKQRRAKAEKEERDSQTAAEIAQLKRERAFLLANDVNWHDKEDALRAVNWEEVEVSSDGTVDLKSLKAELKRLAKAKKHLVKSESDSGDDDADSGKDVKSAPQMNGKKKGSRTEPSREELAKKFPVLQRR